MANLMKPSMNLHLSDKRAALTGSASGISLTTGHQPAEEGEGVVIKGREAAVMQAAGFAA